MAKPDIKKFNRLVDLINECKEISTSTYEKTRAELPSLLYRLIEEFFEQIGDKKFLNMAAAMHSPVRVITRMYEGMTTIVTEPKDGQFLRLDADEFGVTLWSVNEDTKFASVVETFSWE